MKLNLEKFRPFDAANYINTDELRLMFIEGCLQSCDVLHIVDGFGVLLRSLGMKKLSKEIEARAETIYDSKGKEGIPCSTDILELMNTLELKLCVKSKRLSRKKVLAKAPTKDFAKPAPARHKEMATAARY